MLSESPAAVMGNQPVILVLSGTLRGHYHVNFKNPDTGMTFDFDGQGHVQGFGRNKLTGQLDSIGFIALGRAGGTLHLSSPSGKLTLDLTGAPQQGGPKGLPKKFTFTTADATGNYTNVAKNGTLSLVLVPSKHPSGDQGGKFTIVLKSTVGPS
jgi:hypothetical protein